MSDEEVKPLTKQQKYRERVRILMEKHGHKLSIAPSLLDPEDRAALGGGLKCFKMVWERDEDGNKLNTQKRCGNPAKKGSFFCKKHGGGNQRALTTGSASQIESAYRGAFKTEVGHVFDAFVNDPTALDLKPELSALRTLLREYIRKVSAPEKKKKTVKNSLKFIKKTVLDKDINDVEKFLRILKFCSTVYCLTDGESIDRLTRLVLAIGKVVETIDRTQNKEEFLLTPDGLKLMFRGIIDCLKSHVAENKMNVIKNELIALSTRTQGNVGAVAEDRVVEVKAKVL
jgi:hypothetical protein